MSDQAYKLDHFELLDSGILEVDISSSDHKLSLTTDNAEPMACDACYFSEDHCKEIKIEGKRFSVDRLCKLADVAYSNMNEHFYAKQEEPNTTG